MTSITYAALTTGTTSVTASYGAGADAVSKTVLVTVYNVTKQKPVMDNGNSDYTFPCPLRNLGRQILFSL